MHSMNINELGDKRILILGFGKEGRSTLAVLRELYPTKHIAIADKRVEFSIDDPNVELYSGDEYLAHLVDFDVIIKSPGIPYLAETDAVRERITSATQIFFDELDASNTIIAVTGSKGKSTTASLMYEVLRQAGRPCLLIGNIGEPMLNHRTVKDTFIVIELSSYQLQDLEFRPHIALFTSFFPEHIDYHGSLDAYFNAKYEITTHQTSDDVLIYQKRYRRIDDAETRAKKIACGVKSSIWHDDEWFYDGKERLFERRRLLLLGDHNAENVDLIICAARHLDISMKDVAVAVEHFHGLPHRLQLVGTFRGITFYDDAISTTPESTIAALRHFRDMIGVLILGGTDRGYDFSELAKALAEYHIPHVVLFPPTGIRIGQAVKRYGALPEIDYHPDMLETSDMQAAVKYCYDHAKPGQICLLSTASPSYSLFRNFEEKGDRFQQSVRDLAS
jgi:UDP-N-acetylmuramoyl-L-alanine---L-glutamate ligase